MELSLIHISVADKALQEIQDITLRAFEQSDATVAEQVEPLEETIDLMIETMRSRHIQRLKTGECQIDGGTIYLEILTNLERISDHCSCLLYTSRCV